MVFFLVLIGLAVGSFINALVYRLQNNESIASGRSHCTSCGYTLAWYDLIPVISFFMLGARCRSCHGAISWQYPFVELISALSFGLSVLVYRVNGAAAQLTTIIFFIILLIILAYDLKYLLIPDSVSIPSIIVVIGIQIFLHPSVVYIGQLCLAGLFAAGFFYLQFMVSKGKWIGGGDIRFGFLMGVMLGIPQIGIALIGAYILGTVISLPLVALGVKGMKSEVPLGVFLSLATIVTLLWGSTISAWYWHILQ